MGVQFQFLPLSVPCSLRKMCYEGVRFDVISIMMGVSGRSNLRETYYQGLRFNIITIARGWVGGNISRKKCYKHTTLLAL